MNEASSGMLRGANETAPKAQSEIEQGFQQLDGHMERLHMHIDSLVSRLERITAQSRTADKGKPEQVANSMMGKHLFDLGSSVQAANLKLSDLLERLSL